MKPINSRAKGARGERQWRDELRANGYGARRGQQFAGGTESPDVVCPDLPFHFEVKAVEKLNLEKAMAQARRDAGAGVSVGQCSGQTVEQRKTAREDARPTTGRIPVVAHKRNFGPWMVTMLAEDWFKAVRGDFSGTGEPVPQLRVES